MDGLLCAKGQGLNCTCSRRVALSTNNESSLSVREDLVLRGSQIFTEKFDSPETVADSSHEESKLVVFVTGTVDTEIH